MQSGEVVAKARFAMLCNANVQDLMLVSHSGAEKVVYSLQILQRDTTGKQWAIPIGTIFCDEASED